MHTNLIILCVIEADFWSVSSMLEDGLWFGTQVYQIRWNNAKQGPLRRSRSFKVTDFSTNRKLMYDFLLVINTNLPPILHRYQCPPHLISAATLLCKMKTSLYYYITTPDLTICTAYKITHNCSCHQHLQQKLMTTMTKVRDDVQNVHHNPWRTCDHTTDEWLRSDNVIQLGPLCFQTLFQFVQISDVRFVQILLQYSPHDVIN